MLWDMIYSLLHLEIILKSSELPGFSNSMNQIDSNFDIFSALQTSVPEKLFAAFQNEVGNNVNTTDFMGSWVYQAGYPLLTVNFSSDRKSATITQKRYLRNKVNHEDETLWKIPITYASDRDNSDFSSTKPITVLSTETMQIDFKNPIDWIVFNVQQTGNCRVES